jgi:aspartate racemase
MKIIGLVGGTGWISTVEYYRIINEEINKKAGGLNFAKCVLYSFNYEEIAKLNAVNDMEGVHSIVCDASKKLISIGADFIVLCANTLHLYADRLEKEINVPILHIATATTKEIENNKLSCVGLLGTKMTMEKDFYIKRLNEKNIEVIVPNLEEREFINYAIFNELMIGKFKKETKDRFIKIIQDLQSMGAQGIVLGCTEIPLLIKNGDIDLPLFNTLMIHALAAAEYCLETDVYNTIKE